MLKLKWQFTNWGHIKHLDQIKYLLFSSKSIGVLWNRTFSMLFMPFFHLGSLLKSLNQTFLTLIPKVNILEEVSHYRPISICNVKYKIISKILVARLKPFMDKFISPFQNAFIQGWNIINDIMLAHEIFDTLRKKKWRKKGYGALKFDMSKAYDKVNWNFSHTWINWTMKCITSVQYTLLLNGSPTQPFYPSRSIRQGGPISPYLSLHCTNILSIALT